MTRKLTAHAIKGMQNAIETVRDIDATLESIHSGFTNGNAGPWGSDVRDSFGRNRLSQFTHEDLGEIVAKAIVDALAKRRMEITKVFIDTVEFPEPPTMLIEKDASQ